MTRFAYDHTQDPAAPILPLRFAAPGREEGVLVPGFVDTGADCTVIPERLARRLRLPEVDRIRLTGFGGGVRRARVHAAHVEVAGLRCICRVVAAENEAIVGRDVLNRLVAVLDGPAAVLTVRRPRKRG